MPRRGGSGHTIAVVDDDDGFRESLCTLLEADGFAVEPFASAMAFLESETGLSCDAVVCDLRMPRMTGLELQETLRDAGSHLAVIILSGHADVPTAVRALKSGALEFLEKPVDAEILLAAVRRAVEQKATQAARRMQRAEVRARYDSLTPREREVLAEMLTGHPNKVIGHSLGVSPRTVEVHRSRILHKMQVRNLSHLLRVVLDTGLPLEN